MRLYNDNISQEAKALSDTLTLRQKIGQMVQFTGRNVSMLAEKYSYEEIAEIFPFGSVFSGIDVIGLVGKKLKDSELIQSYNKLTKVPLLVAGDLENGGGGELLPPQIVLAAADDPELAYDFGRVIAQRGRCAGFHWTFAPVTDVILNWLAPALGVRTLGSNPKKVAVLAENIIRGMSDFGLMTTAKHFPGDGYDFRNQHLGVASDDMSKEEWEKSFGLVLRRAIAAGVNSVMAGHIALPCVDDRGFPATVSDRLLTGLLRDELGFKGVVVSDALIMGGFVSFRSYAKRMIAMINAGVDVMLWPEPDIFDLVEKAVEWGDIPMSRIDESVLRVLEMKAAAGVIGTQKSIPVADAPDYDEVAREIAERGTVLLRDRNKLLPLDPGKDKNILVYLVDYKEFSAPDVQDERIKHIIDGLKSHGANVTLKSCGSCLDLLDFEIRGGSCDAVIFLVTQVPDYRSRIDGDAMETFWMSSNTLTFNTIVISLYSPYVIMENPCHSGTFINVCSCCPASQRALVKLLYGEIPFTGKNPLLIQADDHALDEWEKISFKSLQ